MLLLESPLEALALRYSAALAGSVWAWLAIVFAALGLWRIRAVGSPSTQPDPAKKQAAAAPAPAPTASVGPAKNDLPPLPNHRVADNGDLSVTKGRYTAYFHAEVDGVEIEGEEAEESDGAFSDVDGEMTGTREWMRGDLGWHRYVDLTALDGSVVRLWDGNGALRRRPRVWG